DLQQSIYRCKRDPGVNSVAAAAAGLKTSHRDFFYPGLPGPNHPTIRSHRLHQGQRLIGGGVHQLRGL
ncbi:MAG: hypothetical protein J6L74_09945, partial [Pseudomonas sp.]|nr:hypothetical protein [Pseudomonas sp.]